MYVLYLILLFLVFIGCVAGTWLRLRQQRAAVVIQTLASIVSQNLPLVPAVRAAARAERRALRRIYTRLALRLAEGHDLSTALRCSLPNCPAEVLGALLGAERGGTLPGVLQAQAARQRRQTWQTMTRAVPTWYPLVLLVVLPGVLAFICIKVLPKYRAIFLDFGTKLPALTVGLFDAARVLDNHSLAVAILFLVAVLALIQALIGRHFFSRVPDRWQPFYSLWDTIVWVVPGLRQGARNYALGQQLLILEAALRAGHDLSEAARQGACAGVNWHARRRLRRWADALERGTDPLAAARQLAFPGPVLQALLPTQDSGTLAARFEYLAEYYHTLHHHWKHVVVSVCTPLMVVAWALMVAYIVLALFLPLVTLVQSVASSTY